jgi:hypothetical protein
LCACHSSSAKLVWLCRHSYFQVYLAGEAALFPLLVGPLCSGVEQHHVVKHDGWEATSHRPNPRQGLTAFPFVAEVRHLGLVRTVRRLRPFKTYVQTGKMVLRAHFAREEVGLGLPLPLVEPAVALLALFLVVSPFPRDCFLWRRLALWNRRRRPTSR